MTTMEQQAEETAVQTAKPGSTSRRRRGPLVIGLGVTAWPLLAFFMLAATLFLFGSVLALVILRSAPSPEALIITGVLVLIATGLCVVVGRFVASRRTVVRVVALVVLMLVPCVIWASAFPDDSTYLSRTVSWGESDVLDYQKFPAREVPNFAVAFRYPAQLTPEAFAEIPYRSAGQQKTADLDELLASSDTTSFPVIKDATIRYEGYFKYPYAAHGHLGQLIAVFPTERVVVVQFGMTDGPVDSWDEVALAIADRLK